MDGFKINIQGVSDTATSLKGRKATFGEYVTTLYSTIDLAKANAWQGPEAEQYYNSIISYKDKLEEIANQITRWENNANKISENFTNASNTITKNINNL